MKFRFARSLATLVSLSSLAAQVVPSRGQFEVASIKRDLSGRPWFWGPHRGGRWVATNASVTRLVALAWKTPLFAISGGPSWIRAEEYDISVKEPDASTTDEEFLHMLRNLLIQRFALKVHTETRVMPLYMLVAAKDGPRLPEATPQPCLAFAVRSAGSMSAPAASQVPCRGMNVTPGLISDDKVSMAWFTVILESLVGRPVVNRTGFSGSFNLHLEFDPLNPGASDGTKPSIFSALREHLGLRLENGRDGAEVLVIDHANRPTEN